MAASRPRASVAALGRAIRCAAGALRTVHAEQVLMWDLFWQSSRVPVDRDGPLAWASGLDGPRLTGSRLPTADESAAAGEAMPQRVRDPSRPAWPGR